MSPSRWLVGDHPSPSPSVWVLQQPLVLVTHPMPRTHPVPCWLTPWHRRCRSRWPLPAAVPSPGAPRRRRGAVSYRKHRWGLRRCRRSYRCSPEPELLGEIWPRQRSPGADPPAAGKGSKSEGAGTCLRCRRCRPRAGRGPCHWHPAMPPSTGLAASAGMRAGCRWRCPFQLGTVTAPAPSGFSARQEHPAGWEGVAGG